MTDLNSAIMRGQIKDDGWIQTINLHIVCVKKFVLIIVVEQICNNWINCTLTTSTTTVLLKNY